MALEMVIFDCDGVLIDSEGLSAAVLLGMLAEMGVEVSFDHFCVNWVGRSFATVAQDIRESFALGLPEGFEAAYRARLLTSFETGLRRTAGIGAVLDTLDLPACVATSSSPERVARSLALTDLAARFAGRVFTASEVARGKPAPDLFLHAAARMGAAPAACLVIEDSLPGVAAAHAAGMRVLRYTGGAHLRGRRLKHGDAVRSFDTWDRFPLLLAELRRGAA